MGTERSPGTGLRVLVINSVLTGGGVDTHTLSLCQALVAEGAQVRLAISHRARWIERARGIAGLSVRVLRQPRWLWPFILGWRSLRDGLDVVHAHHGRDYWVAIATRWFSAQPAAVFVTRHLMTPLRDSTRRYLARWAHVIAVSDAVHARLLEGERTDAAASDGTGSGHAPERLKIRRVHCGIDTQTFVPNAERGQAWRIKRKLPTKAWLFAVVGAIHRPDGKGQFVFLKAAKALCDPYPDVHFLCVGDGDASADLQQQAEAMGLSGRFHWRGFEDQADALMQGIDVLVHPAVATEALGLVILEALACGKPVIASRLDGIGETFVDGVQGLAVPPSNVPALADAMQRLSEDRAFARRLGEAGPGWVAQGFSLRTLGQQTLDAYQAARTGDWR